MDDAQHKTRLMVAKAIALVGVVLLPLSIFAHYGWGPVVKTWSEVTTATGFFLISPLLFIGSRFAGIYRRSYVIVGVLLVVVGGIVLSVGLLEVAGVLR